MEDLSKKILEQYQVRKTKQQKTEFIAMLTSQLEKQGHQVRVEECGPFKSRNIVIGELEKSKIVLGAHYDTAPVLPFPNFLTPKNPLVYLLIIIAAVAVLSTIEVALMEAVIWMTGNYVAGLLLLYALLVFLLVWIFGGKANPHTANDNTSGVVALIEALSKETLAGEVCCVLFDHEEIGLFGSAAFAKKHKEVMKDKLLMNFDCVSDGDTIMLVVSKGARAYWGRLEEAFCNEEGQRKQFLITKSTTTLYPSDQMNFKKNVGVAAFKRNKIFGYYMDRIHTKRDVIFEEENILMIVEGLERLLKE